MNTYPIKPTDKLAVEAAPQVREILATQGNLLIAVRGQDFEYGDGDTESLVYSVSPCPDQDNTAGYEWSYIRAQAWIETFEAAVWAIVDDVGREVVGRRFTDQDSAFTYSEGEHNVVNLGVRS